MAKIFHYTFSTYNRQHILIDDIAEYLGLLFEEICKNKGLKLICYNILIEHVHLLIEKNDADRNEYVMKMIKGISSRRVFEKYSSNRLKFRKLWGRGYRAFEIRNVVELNRVIGYIKGQKITGVDKRINSKWKPRRLVAGFREI